MENKIEELIKKIKIQKNQAEFVSRKDLPFDQQFFTVRGSYFDEMIKALKELKDGTQL